MKFVLKQFALVLIGAFFMLQVLCCFSQGAPRDSSYTVDKVFKKYKKQYPAIKKACSEYADQINVQNDIVYHLEVNRELKLDVFTPKEGQISKRSFVYLIHGGGWSSGSKEHMHQMAIEFAHEGYIAITPEYRLSPESIYPAAIVDVMLAIQWGEQYFNKDKIEIEDIIILGCSSGGQMASLIGLRYEELKLIYGFHNSTRISGIINFDGVLAFDHTLSQEGARASQWLGATKSDSIEIWHEASPIFYVTSGDPPMLFLNSSHERFHAGRDEVVAELKRFGIINRIITFEESPHTFWLFDPWFAKSVSHSMKFLEELQ
ncbi:MAG: alpha/beta hydrolase [Reichenbachiella sp.]